MTQSKRIVTAKTSRTHLSPLAAAIRLALASAVVASLPVAAQSGATTMPEINVVGAADSGYAPKSTSTALKTETPLLDTPQSITIVTKELIRDQAMQSIGDVTRYVPGIETAQGEGNRDTVVFRGSSSTSDFYVDGIRDDVQYYRDLYNIESVEALKGSNAMIFGRGGSGGVINRVTKQAGWNDVREVSLSVGSNSQRRVSADVGQALNDKVALRVNAMTEDSDSYRQGVSIKRSGINPTVAVRLGANTSLVLGYEHFKDERTADRGIPSFKGKPFATDSGTFFGSAEQSPTWARVDAFSALFEHDFGGGVSLRNRTRYADYDKFYQNIFPGAVSADGSTVRISAYNNRTARTNLFNQTDLLFSLTTGAVKHKFATGLEFGSQETSNFRNTGYFPTANFTEVSTANPFVSAPVVFKQSATDADNEGKAKVASVYLQDQIELLPQLQAVLGLRYDRFEVDFLNKRTSTPIAVTDTPVSPRAGLVYKPVPNVSVYANYSLAFVPRAGEQLGSLNATNKAFDPEEFKNLEVGAKWDISPRLAASVAVYQLERSNIAVVDPADATKQILVDGQRTKGVELGISGNIAANWSVMGGYAYQDAETRLSKSATAVAAMVPEHSASLWNRYDFSPVLGAGLGVVYRDEIFTGTSNTVTLASYTRIDAALFYTISKNLKLQLNVENLLDKDYYASANSNDNITPGSPRAFRLALHAKF